MYALSVKNLSKYFYTKDKKIIALDDVSFGVSEGDILGVLGKNGSGKTTLFRCVYGILVPDKGKIYMFGEDVTGDFRKAKKYMMFPFIYTFTKRMTAWDVIKSMAFVFDLDLEYANKLIDLFEFREELNKEYQILSSGNQKKLKIILGLMFKPKILWMDETTNGLDVPTVMELFNHLKKLNKKEKLTIIFASHIMEHVEMLCKKIIILDKGNVIAKGSIDSLRKEAKVKEYITIKLKDKIEKLPKLKKANIVEVEENKYVVVCEDAGFTLKEMGEKFPKEFWENVIDLEVKKPTLSEIFAYFVSKK